MQANPIFGTAVARFEREVQLASQLTHPNTLDIYDYGRSDDGVFYYAMELLDGPDLRTAVEKTGPMPAARVIHLVRQACGALREAHESGLVHRDIKPGNFVLCRAGSDLDVVKLVDFGLVKDVRAAAGSSMSATKSSVPISSAYSFRDRSSSNGSGSAISAARPKRSPNAAVRVPSPQPT